MFFHTQHSRFEFRLGLLKQFNNLFQFNTQMKKNIPQNIFAISASLFLLFNSTIHAQAIFQKAIGGSGNDYAYDMHKAPSGGYFFGGLTSSFPGPGIHLISSIIRTNDNGDTLWAVSYGDTCPQYINDICANSDGGCIAVGGATVCANPNGGGDITRLDANGNILWAKNCANTEDPYPVIQSSDGNFIVGGYVTGIGSGSEDGCIMKLDASTGDTLWSKTYGGPGDEWFYHILQTADGGYLAAGFTTSFGQGGSSVCGTSSLPGKDIYLVKTDANGNLMWSKAYGTSGCEYAFGHCLEATSDGGYILTGEDGSGQGMFLLKIDGSGNMGWSKYYDGQWAHGVKQTPDGGYVMSGTANGDIVLVKTDANGAVLWSKAYGGTNAEQGLLLELASDGGFMVGGYTISFGNGSKDFYIVKTDANGTSGCNETNLAVTSTVAPFLVTNAATQVMTGTGTTNYIPIVHRGLPVVNLCSTVGIDNQEKMKVLELFPNPTNNSVTVQSSSELGMITIYDALGEIVFTQKSNATEQQIDLSGFSSGIYFLSAQGKYLRLMKE